MESFANKTVSILKNTGSNILYIHNEGQLRAFHDTYYTRINDMNRTKLSQEYDGIKISPYMTGILVSISHQHFSM